MSTLSEDCQLHCLMMPMPDAGQCWYCARDAMLVEQEQLSDGLYVYVRGSGTLDIPVGGQRLVMDIDGEPRLSTRQVGPFTVRVYENNWTPELTAAVTAAGLTDSAGLEGTTGRSSCIQAISESPSQ